MDNNNLFIKSGVNVIAALAGEGKTTYLHSLSEDWKDTYNVFHFNFDNAPTYGKDMINCPVTEEEFKDFWKLLNDVDENTILIFDSLKAMTSYLGLDIELNTDIYPLMMRLRVLVKQTKATVILVHHVYKAKNVKTMPTSFYGSRAIEEQCDSGFIFESDKYRIVKNRAGHVRDKIITKEK